ncbi:MAG: radical SAM protein [Nanoarchaeota archaeon]|nr:radical SAM protein [Nanoarchaeota archaeon]
MKAVIIDCYTDEPAGLGVPPYIGTYPRYIAGALKKEKKAEHVFYLTIDDLRLKYLFDDNLKVSNKTNILAKNITPNYKEIFNIIEKSDLFIVNAGVHTPGKYLSAQPGTLAEIKKIIDKIIDEKQKNNTRFILTGPAGSLHGTRLEGGKFAEKIDKDFMANFTEINENYLDINNYEKIKDYSTAGADIVKQHPDFNSRANFLTAEIETGKGCSGNCSFCVEPKNRMEFREQKDIISEIKALHDIGVRHFRLGKQTCFYSYKRANSSEIIKLLRGIREACPKIKTLHIDNVAPNAVVNAKESEEITKAIVEFCTPGNIAAFGVESFDNEVIKANNLNSDPETTLKAVEMINKHGAVRGGNGMHKFLPGINLLFGLNKESKKTHEENMRWLEKITEKNLIRRINIRQVAILEGTPLLELCGNKYLRKNKKYYWKWREEIRQKIDFPMLKKLLPEGTIMKQLRTEIHDGNTTFCRQAGTYPLIVGVKQKLELDRIVDIKVKSHMLRSIVGEIVE